MPRTLSLILLTTVRKNLPPVSLHLKSKVSVLLFPKPPGRTCTLKASTGRLITKMAFTCLTEFSTTYPMGLSIIIGTRRIR